MEGLKIKEYFSHDYNARNDPRIVKLFMTKGLLGIGLYWCVIEMLYESNGYIMHSECERIAFELRTDCETIKLLISDFDLFKVDKKRFWSESVLKRLNLRKEKSNKAKHSASVRWNNANALQTQSEGNAIKLKKRKEKENKEIDNKKDAIKNLCKKAEFEKVMIAFDEWRDYLSKQHDVKLLDNEYTYDILIDAIRRVGDENIIESIHYSMISMFKKIYREDKNRKPMETRNQAAKKDSDYN